MKSCLADAFFGKRNENKITFSDLSSHLAVQLSDKCWLQAMQIQFCQDLEIPYSSKEEGAMLKLTAQVYFQTAQCKVSFKLMVLDHGPLVKQENNKEQLSHRLLLQPWK